MEIEKIQENIKKNEEKLEKAEKNLQKKIAKCSEHFEWFRQNNIQPTWEDCCRVRDTENRYDQFEHLHYIEDWSENKNLNARHYAENKIAGIKKALENWKEKLVKENLISNKLENLPESIKSMFEYLKDLWISYELENNQLNLSEEEIIKRVETDVKYSILDLLNRVSEVAGEIEDWQNVRWNGKALNGTLKGSKNNVRVETITAGGYNIQRYHYRVLVHKI